jgi:hypothetical protein
MEAAAPPPASPQQPYAGPPARRVDVGNVISETFSMYGSHAVVLIGTALVIYGVVGVINGILNDEGGILLSLVALALSIVGSTIYAGMVVRVVQHDRQGTPASLGETLQSVLPVVGVLILNGFLKGLAVLVGLALLIIPGIFLATMWAVTGPAIVVERAGIFDAFQRSWDLVRGEFWPVLGAFVLAYLILAAAGILATAIGVGIGLVGSIILTVLFQALAAPFIGLVSAIIFFDLGGGQTAAAPAAPAQPPPPPAAPAA